MDWPILLFVLVGSIVGSILKDLIQGFFREKGKQLATREDIEKVLEKVRRVTEETERIRDEISGDRCVSQKVWEERKLLYVELINEFQKLDDLWIGVTSRRSRSLYYSWFEEYRKFIVLRIKVQLLSGNSVGDKMEKLSLEILRIMTDFRDDSSDQNLESAINKMSEIIPKYAVELPIAARADLRIS